MTDAPIEGTVRSADGTTIAYERSGSGPTVVLVDAAGAVILAEVATDRASPLSEPAGELLAAYLAEAGAIRLVERAASVRAGLGPLDGGRPAEATALVRQAIPQAVPTPRAAADGRPGDLAPEGAGR